MRVQDVCRPSQLGHCRAGGWRNGLLMDPLKKYGAFSYADVMLYPLAAALAATGASDTQVLFGMQVRALDAAVPLA